MRAVDGAFFRPAEHYYTGFLPCRMNGGLYPGRAGAKYDNICFHNNLLLFFFGLSISQPVIQSQLNG
jgi:hypothetical protein